MTSQPKRPASSVASGLLRFAVDMIPLPLGTTTKGPAELSERRSVTVDPGTGLQKSRYILHTLLPPLLNFFYRIAQLLNGFVLCGFHLGFGLVAVSWAGGGTPLQLNLVGNFD